MSAIVTVTSLRPPAFGWPCPTCGERRPFDCAERFRANCSGKLVERTPVRRVPRALLEAAQRNDAAAARACARDVALLKRNGMAVVDGDQWAIDGVVPGAATLVFVEPLLVRLDHVLAAVFELPRRAVPTSVRVYADQRRDVLRLWSGEVRAARGPRPPS